MTTTPDQWSQKFLREHPFMAFGSMMNAYANINLGKGCSVDELGMIAEKLFSKAIELTKRAYDETIQETYDNVDFPMK